jgi:hypothetical protein
MEILKRGEEETRLDSGSSNSEGEEKKAHDPAADEDFFQ